MTAKRIEIRKLEIEDLDNSELVRSILLTLMNLDRTVFIGGDMENNACEVLLAMLKKPEVYSIFIALDRDCPSHGILGLTALLIEQKLIHNGGKVGHIEDVVTRRGWEGWGIGRAVVAGALEEAKKQGCYKVILNCHEYNVPFYEKLDFRRYDIGMRIDFDS